MQKYIVIADDLTGSNATCSLFKKIGLRAASILKLQGDIKKKLIKKFQKQLKY